MSNEPITFLTPDELNAIKRRARKAQADAMANGVRALVHWLAHPSLHLRHA